MSAFEVTFLGHQGWLFSAGESRLLVDALLTPAFGHKGAIGQVYPPRVFAFEAFPTVDALLITHEHEDHFDIPSLAAIDRRVPVLLSARSSRAAQTVLAEMGFTVHRVDAGDKVTIGDLDLHLFAPDLNERDMSDEWDVLPFLVRDRRGHGAFFTTVDVAVHDRLEAGLRTFLEQPPVWCYTNNAGDWSFTEGGTVLAAELEDSKHQAARCLEQYSSLCFRWGPPPAVLMCGGGFAFTGDRAWMNEHVFCADSEAMCAALGAVTPGRTFLAARPGQSLVLEHGALTAVRSESAFLRCAPSEECPRRTYAGEAPLLDAYRPFSGARELGPEELAELGRELDGFAAHLCSRKLFRELLSLERRELGGRRPTFSLVALCDEEGGAYVYEYDLAACAFVRVRDTDPVADYVGGLECWASDLLAAFRGELAPSAVAFGRSRVWNALPERCLVGRKELWLYCHPLRRPDRFLRLYREMLGSHATDPVCVRAPERARPIALNTL